MKRKKMSRKSSKMKFKKGMSTNVRNFQDNPSRGGIRL